MHHGKHTLKKNEKNINMEIDSKLKLNYANTNIEIRSKTKIESNKHKQGN
jgi:hypothetical protein